MLKWLKLKETITSVHNSSISGLNYDQLRIKTESSHKSPDLDFWLKLSLKKQLNCQTKSKKQTRTWLHRIQDLPYLLYFDGKRGTFDNNPRRSCEAIRAGGVVSGCARAARDVPALGASEMRPSGLWTELRITGWTGSMIFGWVLSTCGSSLWCRNNQQPDITNWKITSHLKLPELQHDCLVSADQNFVFQIANFRFP